MLLLLAKPVRSDQLESVYKLEVADGLKGFPSTRVRFAAEAST
jgi:hypothetical protein